jgi:ribosomal protein L7Ae-like RNA K-turn-binding protein
LQQFTKREGHCNVPQSHTEDEANLGTWVNTQRQLKTKEKLDPDRKRRLEEIGFKWVASATWDEMHALLRQFKKREGHCYVPQSHIEDKANLGTWVTTQRQLKTRDKLDPDRKKRLEDIGFEWRLPSARWDETCALLKQFKKREGHCNVPQSHTEDEANLGKWVNNQRQLKTKEKLDSDRLKRLEEIGFKWAREATAH